jgi:transposase
MKKRITSAADVSAKQLVVAIEGCDKIYEFTNDEEGIATMLRVLKKARVTRLIIEPTGNYALDAMIAAYEKGIVVHAVNPRAARNFARSTMQRAKTDRVDALMLLQFGMSREFEPWSPPAPDVLALRSIARRLGQVVKALAAEKARRKAAQSTHTTPKFVLDSLERLVQQLEAEGEALVDGALEICRRNAELGEALQLLTTIRGVAERSAVKLLAELATFPTDLTARQIVAMAGLDPRPVESGNFVGQRRISKLGNPNLRGALFMAAHNAILYEPVAKSLYEDLVGRGKHTMKAKTAVMRKLLIAMWGMLRAKTAFSPEKFRRAPTAAAA